MVFSSVRAQKLYRDIWAQKSKTLMIVIATAIGVFAFGTLTQTWAILTREIATTYTARHPAHATFSTGAIDQDLVEAVGRMQGVAAAEGRGFTRMRVWVPGAGWRVLVLIAQRDFQASQINQLWPQAGQWPPPKDTLLLERTSLAPLAAAIGQPLLVELPDGRQRSIVLAGTVHDLTQLPGSLTDLAFFGYVTIDTAHRLGLPDTYNQLSITVSEDAANVAHIQQVAQTVEQRLKDLGHQALGVSVPEPGQPILYSVTQSLFVILNVLGIFTLVFTALLIVNTISGLLGSHIQQIGVMKAIGAPRGDIIALYSSMIVIFGSLALVVAVPAAMVAAGILSQLLASLLNFDIRYWQMSSRVILWQIVAGLLMPLVAALLPILRGTRTTVREAISANTQDHFGSGLIDRLLGRLQRGAAALRYALRNMFRRKGRLALTVCALAVGGSLFITVLNTIEALRLTVNADTSAYWQQDVTVNFQRPERPERVVLLAERVPGVVAVEGWSTQMGVRTYADERESREDIALFGVPSESIFVRPTLLAGRWLRPDDVQALVVNIYAVQKEPDLGVGSMLTLKINGRESSWQIVGVVTSQMLGFTEVRPEMQIMYANATALSRAAGTGSKADRIVLRVADPSERGLETVVASLEQVFGVDNLKLRSIETNTRLLQVINRMIGILTALLTFAAAMFAAVGGLSLTSTMTLNVLERIREIGVLRAIGGSHRTVRDIILYEGAAIGLLSWILGVILSIPLSLLMNYVLGRSFLGVPLRSSFPLYSPFIWLALAVTIALVASYVPARSAARLTVRETLAYTS